MKIDNPEPWRDYKAGRLLHDFYRHMTKDHRALKHLRTRVACIESLLATLYEPSPVIATNATIVPGTVYPSGQAPR